MARDTKFKPGQSGNPSGKPKGLRNKKNLLPEAIENERESFLIECFAEARAGNSEYAKLFLDRWLPAKKRDNHIYVDDLKGSSLDKARKVIDCVTKGLITPIEGNLLMSCLTGETNIQKHVELKDMMDKILDKFGEGN